MVDHISMDEFDKIRFNSGPVSEELKAIREMEVGQVIVISHEKYAHGHVGMCGIMAMAKREGRRSNKRYSIKHLPGGVKVAIACQERN